MTDWTAELEAHKAATRAWLRSEIDFLATRRRVLAAFRHVVDSTSSGQQINIHDVLETLRVTPAEVAQMARSGGDLHSDPQRWRKNYDE